MSVKIKIKIDGKDAEAAMPFESKAQMRGAFGGYLGPEMKRKAKQWAKETPDAKKLPEHKTKKDSSGANYVSSNALAGNSAEQEPRFGATVPYKKISPYVADPVKPVARIMNPVEAERKANNAARDARTNLGRGKGGAVPTVEEENGVRQSW